MFSFFLWTVSQGSLQPGLPQAYTNKEASKQMRQSTLSGQRARRREAQQGPVGSLIPQLTTSHSGMPLLPTVVVSVEPREVNISSIRSGGLICLQWWQQWIPSRWFIPALHLPVLGGQRTYSSENFFYLIDPESYIPTSDAQLRKQPFTLCRWYQQGLIRSS